MYNQQSQQSGFQDSVNRGTWRGPPQHQQPPPQQFQQHHHRGQPGPPQQHQHQTGPPRGPPPMPRMPPPRIGPPGMVGPPSIGPPQHMGPPSYPPPQVQYAMPMPPQPPQEAEKKKDEEEKEEEKKVKPKANRMVAGKVWHDESLEEWDTSDFRCFVGDLGNEVSDDGLARAFAKYTSMQKAKVVRDKRNSKSRGYGFVSFKDPNDFMKAMKEMNGKYIGNRPIKMRKSSWKERDFGVAKKRQKKKEELLGKKSVGKNKGKNRAAMKFS